MEASGAGYEFSPLENETIAKAAKWIGFWSWVAIVGGALIGVASAVSFDLAGLIMAVVYVIIGLYYRGAATSMKSVVETAGNDIAHLMTALDKLASAFKIMGILFIIGIVLAVIAGMVGGIAEVAG